MTFAEVERALCRFVYQDRESLGGLQVGQQCYRLTGTLAFGQRDHVRKAERDSLRSEKRGELPLRERRCRVRRVDLLQAALDREGRIGHFRSPLATPRT